MSQVERALILHKNGTIVDADGDIVCRIVYGSRKLQRYIFDVLCNAPSEIMVKEDVIKSDDVDTRTKE